MVVGTEEEADHGDEEIIDCFLIKSRRITPQNLSFTPLRFRFVKRVGEMSEVRHMQSSPVAVYWIEATENLKLESILIFIVSTVYIITLFQKRE